jgi:hypothetical protein
MEKIALVVGLLAVALFLLSYLQKRRGLIVTFNLTSRVLYIVQYLLLGAFEGAVLDIWGAISAFLAQRSDKGFIKKFKIAIFVIINLLIVVSGILLYENIFSLFPMIGILLQAGALWLKNEKYIRIVSMLGCPFWFTYNFVSTAYGSCIGDALAFVSLGVSLVRYDILGVKKAAEAAQPDNNG